MDPVRKKSKSISNEYIAPHFLDRPVEVSNMYPSLRGPNSAAFPLAIHNKDFKGNVHKIKTFTRKNGICFDKCKAR